MNQTISTSESIKSISKALLEFQMEVGKIEKDSKNPFFNSKYASLHNILSVINPALQTVGLVVSQFPFDDGGLLTILMHPDSGEFIQASCLMKPVKNDPQSIGSAITYMRRYAITSVLCLNIDEDDDGNHASQPQQQSQQRSESDNRPWLSEKQFEQALDRIMGGEEGVYEKINAAFRMKKTYREQLQQPQFQN